VVPILGLLGCLFVMGITSRPTILIGLGIIASTLIWYVFFLRERTQLVGVSNELWQKKIIRPLVAKAEDYAAARRDAFPVILLPLSNPATEGALLRVGTALAKARRARLHLAHVVSLPRQTPLEAGRMEFEQMRHEQETLLDVASRHASEQGIRARTNALVAHSVPSALLNIADIEQTDIILMGWRGDVRGPLLRGTNVAGVAKAADRNILVLKDNGLSKVDRILVPVGRGPHAKLGLKVAQQLAVQWGAKITAMTVRVDREYSDAVSAFDLKSRQFLEDYGEEFVGDILKKVGVTAEIVAVIDTSISQGIIKIADDYDLIIIGASEEWVVHKWLFGSIPDKVANHVSVSVLMVRSKD
jgi:nucleotide-binding universal stress UspA family protein